MDQPQNDELAAIRMVFGDAPSSADDGPTAVGMRDLLRRLGAALKTSEFQELRRKLFSGEITREEFKTSLESLANHSGK